MFERNLFRRPASDGNGSLPPDEGGLRAPPGLSPLGKVWWWFHFAILVKLARLRFIAVLLAIGGVIAYWDSLRAHYEKWTRPLFGQETAVSPDSEYWCPMHPSVVRDHPDKCPLCAMPLSKRKKGAKGEDEALPPGVVSRVQLTPYKVAVAGIETAEVGYLPLTREVSAIGIVEFDEQKLARISARATGKSRIDKLYVNVTGQMVTKGQPLALLYSHDLAVTVENLLNARGHAELQAMNRARLERLGIDREQIEEVLRTGKPVTQLTIRSPISGHVIRKYQVEGEYIEEGTPLYDVADLSTVWVEAQVYEDDIAFLQLGDEAHASTRALPGRDFLGKLALLHPHLNAATRTLKVRFDVPNPDHELRPGTYAAVRLTAPATRLRRLTEARGQEWGERLAADLAVHAMLSPALPGVGGGVRSLADGAVQESLARQGQVLVVPERAVIDTGSHQFVYREAESDVYEGIEVQLGPPSGGFYPVLRGLQAGEKVVTTGSFLIDAETRLGGGAASTYFGASGGPHGDHHPVTAARPSMTRDEDSRVQATLTRLSPLDRRLVEEQVICPVQGTHLGAMGVPVKVVLQDQPVFLCCKVCLKEAKADPKGILAKVAELKERARNGSLRQAPAPAPEGGQGEDATVRKNLARLSAEDRRLAVEQGFCPIEPDNRLGEMAVPYAVEIKGRKVFLCCQGCKKDALANPERTLAEAERLKARRGQQPPK
jgi:Cu(I)/Ag(I) efflux system membrane fusion protein